MSNSGPSNFRSIHLGLGLGPNLIDRKLGGPEPDTALVSGSDPPNFRSIYN